jgi:DNA repair protein RadC
VTDRLREAGELLGINVLDHVVVAGGRFHSFADGRTSEVQEVS